MSTNPHTTWTDDRRRTVANLLREGKTASQIGSYLDVSRNAVIGVVQRDPALREIGFVRSAVRAERLKRTLMQAAKQGRRKSADTRSKATAVKAAPNKPIIPAVIQVVCEEVAPEPVVVSEPSILEPLALPLSDLDRNQCRFAVNNAARGEQHLFCGHAMKIGSSFCEHHHDRVFIRPAKAGAA